MTAKSKMEDLLMSRIRLALPSRRNAENNTATKRRGYKNGENLNISHLTSAALC